MVAELSSLKQNGSSVGSRQPRWIQISTSHFENRFGDTLKRIEIKDGRISRSDRVDDEGSDGASDNVEMPTSMSNLAGYANKITGLVEPYRARADESAMDDVVAEHRRRSFTVHRGTFLLKDEELVQETPPGRPEVSPRKRPVQEVDPNTPGRENWRLSESASLAGRSPRDGTWRGGRSRK